VGQIYNYDVQGLL